MESANDVNLEMMPLRMPFENVFSQVLFVQALRTIFA